MATAMFQRRQDLQILRILRSMPAEAAAEVTNPAGLVLAARAADDPHLTYVDGLDLHGPADEAERPLPDALHPDAETHRIVAERFARLAL